MTADESANHLGGPYAARLGSERTYYRNEQWPADMLDRLKPYAWLSPPEVNSLVAVVR